MRKDTTLRILRAVGEKAAVNWLVVNLFDFATPKPTLLHQNWQARDAGAAVFGKLDLHDVHFVLFAYGDLDRDHKADYENRIRTIREAFRSLRSLAIPTTRAGYPSHPTNWQRQRRMPEVVAAIVAARQGA